MITPDEILSEFARRHWPRLVRIARKNLPASQRREAPDLAQEAFCRFIGWLNAERLLDPNNHAGVLFTCLHRATATWYKNYYRTRRNWVPLDGEIIEERGVPDTFALTHPDFEAHYRFALLQMARNYVPALLENEYFPEPRWPSGWTLLDPASISAHLPKSDSWLDESSEPTGVPPHDFRGRRAAALFVWTYEHDLGRDEACRRVNALIDNRRELVVRSGLRPEAVRGLRHITYSHAGKILMAAKQGLRAYFLRVGIDWKGDAHYGR